MSEIQTGDEVKLLGVPDWLVQDLPDEERRSIVAFVGRTATVKKIDQYGYYWLGFGHTTNTSAGSEYQGHTFCVPREFLKRI